MIEINNLKGWHPSPGLNEDIEYQIVRLEARYYDSAQESARKSQNNDEEMEFSRVDEIMTSLFERFLR